MSLRERIDADIKAAMRARDKARVGVLRMLSSALREAEIEHAAELPESDEVAVVNKLIKQRRDSAQQYRDADREDLAEGEDAEAAVLAEYLPPALSDADLDAAIDDALAETGAQGPQEMGKVMGLLKERVQGQADMGEVSRRVKERLSS